MILGYRIFWKHPFGKLHKYQSLSCSLFPWRIARALPVWFSSLELETGNRVDEFKIFQGWSFHIDIVDMQIIGLDWLLAHLSRMQWSTLAFWSWKGDSSPQDIGKHDHAFQHAESVLMMLWSSHRKLSSKSTLQPSGQSTARVIQSPWKTWTDIGNALHITTATHHKTAEPSLQDFCFPKDTCGELYA